MLSKPPDGYPSVSIDEWVRFRQRVTLATLAGLPEGEFRFLSYAR